MRASSILLIAGFAVAAMPAAASPILLVDALSGDILASQEPTRSWHPASLTKMMTAHLALTVVEAGRLRMDTSIVMSTRAVAQAPTKLGVPPGYTLRLEDALRVMMAKSTNDVAVAVAEAMNAEAARLGMSGTHFVNVNGLHDDRQVTNARDMAVLMLVLVRNHPEHTDLFRTRVVTVNGRRLENTNKMVGRYVGLEASKTGYVCASGFNVAVSAARGGRRVIGIVLGPPSAARRTQITRDLLDVGLSGRGSRAGNLSAVKADAPSPAVDLRAFRCGRGTVETMARLERVKANEATGQ